MTAMLLVSPVTWDISMVFLLLPLAIIARTAETSRWMPIALILILVTIGSPRSN